MSWTRWAATFVGISALAVFAVVERATLRDSIRVFGHLQWDWLALAVVVETISMTAFGLAQRHLVVVAGHGAPVGHAVRTAYAGNAISGSVPFVGSQLGTLFTFRAYRRHGADGPTVAWALAIAGVFSALAYGIIAGTGAVLSGNPFATGAIAGSSVAVLTSAASGWWALRRAEWRPRLIHRAVHYVTWRQRVTQRSFGEPREIVAVAFERFDALRPRRVEYAKVFLFEIVNALGDVAGLALCIVAVGGGVPWTRLILVWVAGNTAAALLYRVVSFWMLVALGWLVHATTRRAVPAPA